MRDQPLVLVVDDDLASQVLLERLLKAHGYQVLTAADGPAGLQHASQLLPDLILLDIRMPGVDGFEVCHRLKQSLHTADIPVIFLTAEQKSDLNVTRGFGAGACDYVTKPFIIADVLVRVRQAIHQRQQQELFQQLATRDPLTGLSNHGQLMLRLDARVAEARRHGVPFAVILGDLDDFKSVNDTYGHQFGDEVLVRFAGLLQSQSRADDVVARYGGDEFAILVSHGDADCVRQMAERIREAWAATPFQVDQQARQFTASFGVVAWGDETHSLSGEGLIEHADQALYAAKEAGRNRVACNNPMQPAPATR